MTTLIILIVVLVVLIVMFIAFLIISSRSEKTLKTMDENGKIKTNVNPNVQENNPKKKDTGISKSVYKKEDVFKFMEFDQVIDDMIVQNGGSRFTMAIKCKGVNYDLMSDVEQLAVEEGFITFLNTLKYPIQLYVSAQNIDLKGVIHKYKENTAEIFQQYEDINKRYNKLVSSFDVDDNELSSVTKERDRISNVYEYAEDMINYVEKMSANKNLLERNFYVVVSYNTSEIAAVDKFDKDEIVEMCYTELHTRCVNMLSGLSACSITGNILNSNELADLLYSAYNRDDRGLVSVEEALDSGIFRLYSTSEDAINRKSLAIDQYLQDSARIQALEALRDVVIKGEISTDASREIDQKEEISRRATNIVKSEDLDQEVKNKVSRKILENFREEKKELLEQDKVQKQEIIEEQKASEPELNELKSKPKPKGIELLEKSKEYSSINTEENDKENNVEKAENSVDETTTVNEHISEKNTQSTLLRENNNMVDDNSNTDEVNNLYNSSNDEDEVIF